MKGSGAAAIFGTAPDLYGTTRQQSRLSSDDSGDLVVKMISPIAWRRRCLSRLAPILAGLFVTQIIATAFIRTSNLRLFALVTAAGEAGYFTIPTPTVAAMLQSFSTAFYGGLFFTFSLGIGLTFATWSALLIRRHFPSKRILTVILALGWASLLITLNAKGVTLIPTLFAVLVPMSTAGTAYLLASKSAASRTYCIAPLTTGIVLALLWTPLLGKDLFPSIRDRLLLSNPLGQRINAFYYRYTLSAAEPFRSFDQKTLRSSLLEGLDHRQIRQWENLLAKQDVLVLPAVHEPDVRLVFSGSRLQLISPTGRQTTISTSQFLDTPKRCLHLYSETVDRFAPLRQLTYLSLLFGVPLVTYIVGYGFVYSLWRMRYPPPKAALSASGLCLMIGGLLYAFTIQANGVTITRANLDSALSDVALSTRIAALKFMEKNQIDPANFPSYRRLYVTPSVVERYWLARSMAYADTDESYAYLTTLLDAPQQNLVCQALYALGERGRPEAITLIKEKVAASNHWYSQWYGYTAMRKLGWTQKLSD